MSDPKRANLITVSAPKSAKVNVKKTVRLTIDLYESNESKYPELDYKELVRAEASKEKRVNGKTTTELDPFSDYDEEVERVARKFEQKYGGNSTYGKKGRKKCDDFADIGAGYDENDSFIDNTDGYDEMIPPGIDTLHGGFYINCGTLEFTTVPENQNYPEERNKRRKSSSSSSSKESESSSDSDSQDVKDQKGMVNGNVDSHETEHRKKKNKKIDKKKAKIRRTDSSAPTSGKQTSDDNGHGDGESGDSRTSQSDSLTSKPAPSSENAITSDSSRDAESKMEMKQLPAPVNQLLEELEVLSRQLNKDDNKTESCIGRLDRALTKTSASDNIRQVTLSRAAKILNVSTEAKILSVLKHTLPENSETTAPSSTTSQIAQSTANITSTSTNSTNTTKRKAEDMSDKSDVTMLTAEEKQAKIEETLQRLKVLIEERTPGMMASYQADCERVQEEKKKLQIATASEGAPHIDKRRPKRRFPWCPRSRSLLARLATLAGDPEAGAALLARRALPLFPAGFARMPTLLKQADLNKEVKASDIKRPRLGSSSQPVISNPQFIEPIQFPSSLTVTTTVKTTDKIEEKDPKYKVNPAAVLGLNAYNIHKDLVVENERKKEDRSKDDTYIPNNIGSITITPVVSQKEKKEPLLRVKSPAALNDMISKKEKKKPERKQVTSPLHIETNHSNKKDLVSPKLKDEVTQKQIESMRIAENNLPRPGLVSVHHSPTFSKPDKRAPEVKRKKDVLIISDQDPLADNLEPLNVDSCSSDVELVEDTSELKVKSEVPLKGVNTSASVKQKSDSQLDEATKEIDDVMRSLREIQYSQEPTKLNCNSFGAVLSNAKREMSKAIRRPDTRDDFAE